MKEKNFAAAMGFYKEALEIAQNSTMDAQKKVKAPKAPKPEKEVKVEATGAEIEDAGKKIHLSNPKQNVSGYSGEVEEGILAAPKKPQEGHAVYCENTPAQLEEHLKVTGGRIQTRFPPEPNGYLHLGHAKAMNFNFGQARLAGGVTYMRFDDTNPEAEKQEYIDSILGSVNWLGNHPFKITYSSDYFQELYELAVKLIKVGKAYVCHQTQEDMKAARAKLREAHIQAAKSETKLTEIPEGDIDPEKS